MPSCYIMCKIKFSGFNDDILILLLGSPQLVLCLYGWLQSLECGKKVCECFWTCVKHLFLILTCPY